MKVPWKAIDLYAMYAQEMRTWPRETWAAWEALVRQRVGSPLLLRLCSRGTSQRYGAFCRVYTSRGGACERCRSPFLCLSPLRNRCDRPRFCSQ